MLDILKNPHDAKEQEKAATRQEFSNKIAEITRLSKAELPKIGAAFSELDTWVGENLAGIAPEELPRSLSDILFEIDRLRGTPSQVQEVLREVGRITIHDLWGDRPKRDLTRLPAVVNSIANRLRLAQGCAAAVTRLFVQLKMVCADLEEKSAWAHTTGIGPEKQQAAPLIQMPQPKAAGVKVDTDNFEI